MNENRRLALSKLHINYHHLTEGMLHSSKVQTLLALKKAAGCGLALHGGSEKNRL